MPLETINIASVETAVTKSGPNAGSQYRIVNAVDGRKLFCFDQKLFAVLDHAKSIGGEIQPSKDGKSLRIVNAAEQVGSNGHAASGPTPNDTRDINIRRQVALKAAVDAVGPLGDDRSSDGIDKHVAMTLDLADHFVIWLTPSADDGADPW